MKINLICSKKYIVTLLLAILVLAQNSFGQDKVTGFWDKGHIYPNFMILICGGAISPYSVVPNSNAATPGLGNNGYQLAAINWITGGLSSSVLGYKRFFIRVDAVLGAASDFLMSDDAESATALSNMTAAKIGFVNFRCPVFLDYVYPTGTSSVRFGVGMEYNNLSIDNFKSPVETINGVSYIVPIITSWWQPAIEINWVPKNGGWLSLSAGIGSKTSFLSNDGISTTSGRSYSLALTFYKPF